MTHAAEPELEAALAEALHSAGAGPVVIGDLRRLSGGASRETWSFTAITGTDRLRLVLQRVRGGLTMAGPSIAAVVGCPEPAAGAAHTAGCDRAGGTTITVNGASFGAAGATIFIGTTTVSARCIFAAHELAASMAAGPFHDRDLRLFCACSATRRTTTRPRRTLG